MRLIRSAAKEAIARSEDAFRQMQAGLKSGAQEIEQQRVALSSAAQATSASLQELSLKTANDAADQLAKVSEAALAQSVQQLKEQTDTMLARATKELQEQSDGAAVALRERLDAEQQRFLAETHSEFENLRASRQLFLDDTQQQTVALVGRSLESLSQGAVEKLRAEFEASRANLMRDSQAQLVSNFRSSLDLLAKDATKAQAELAASRQKFMAETQSQLDTMVQASADRLEAVAAAALEQVGVGLTVSHQQFLERAKAQLTVTASSALEPEIANAVERGRRELGEMVDRFLAKAVPQIQAELEKLVHRHTENIRAQSPQVAAQSYVAESVAAARPVSQPVEAAPPEPSVPAWQSAPMPAPTATRWSEATGMDPQAVAASPLARLPMNEPRRSAPSSLVPPLGRGLDFRLAERAPKHHRIQVTDVKAGVSSGVKLGLGLGIIALLTVGIYLVASPVIRLRPSPPAAFFEDRPAWTATERTRENDLARAYWAVAVTRIAPQYPFGSTLPVDPPDDFTVPEAGGSAETASAVGSEQARYWEKLREVWPEPDSWERTSMWDPESIRASLRNAWSNMNRRFSSSDDSAP